MFLYQQADLQTVETECPTHSSEHHTQSEPQTEGN